MNPSHSSRAPVLVFDLDDTILSCNSFPLWVLFLMTGRIGGLGLPRRVKLSVRTAHLLASRKMARLNHDELQRRLQAASADLGAADVDRFVGNLLLRARPSLRWLLDVLVDQRADMVLATAAAADYAEPLGQQLGFRHILATNRGRSQGERANSGKAKRDRVAAHLRAIGWSGRPLILFTDHVDDLPLMQDSMAVYWFGSPDMLAQARAVCQQTDFLDCRDMTGENLYSRLLPLCGHATLREGANEPASSEITLS